MSYPFNYNSDPYYTSSGQDPSYFGSAEHYPASASTSHTSSSLSAASFPLLNNSTSANDRTQFSYPSAYTTEQGYNAQSPGEARSQQSQNHPDQDYSAYDRTREGHRRQYEPQRQEGQAELVDMQGLRTPEKLRQDQSSFTCVYPGCLSAANGSRFTRHTDLGRHMKSVHSLTSVDCPHKWCGRTGPDGFSRQNHLREHLAQMHGGLAQPPSRS